VPVEAGMGLVAIQFEKIRLVKGLRGGEVFPGTIAPVFDKPVGHFGGRQMAAVLRPEIPGAGIFSWFLRKKGTEQQVAAEGFQDVLPGPDGTGIADADAFIGAQSPNAVRNDTIFTPIPTADDVARPGGGGAEPGVDIAAVGVGVGNLWTRYRILSFDRLRMSVHSGHVPRFPGHVPRILLREERFQICAENEFRTPLRGAVGVMTAHRVIFTITPDPFLVFIAFVAGDVDQDFHAGG